VISLNFSFTLYGSGIVNQDIRKLLDSLLVNVGNKIRSRDLPAKFTIFLLEQIVAVEEKQEEAEPVMSMWKSRLAAKLFPWHIELLDKINHNALVRRWIAEQHGRIPTFGHLYDFYRYVHGEVCGGTAIDFLELGVYQGHSIRFWSQMNRDPQSRFIGFDSFEGLPENFTKKFTKGTANMDGAVPQVDDERVSFVKGWFQTTLLGFVDGFTPRSRLVVHNDSNLYSSTLFAFATLNTLLLPGTVVILDDFSHPIHGFRAFADFRRAFWRSAQPVAMTADYAMQAAFVFD
jgi:O-methyltransferase